MRNLFSLILISLVHLVDGQLTKKQIDHWADDYFVESVLTLRDFLTIPNLGSNESDVAANLKWCKEAFQSIEFETEVLFSNEVPYILAEKSFGKERPTILFYLQIDGQPVDSSEWNQESPFIPVLKENDERISWDQLKNWDREWKLFARSASDSKGPAIALFQSLRILFENGIDPSFNIKVIMDFQEEMGSPTLPSLVESNRNRFSANALLIMDGTRPPENLPTLTFGARGIATMQLTVFGARSDLHSGQYGNYSPNPVFGLAKLLAGMKDETGKVLIPGYYDGVSLSAEQKSMINSLPENKREILETLGIAMTEEVGETYQEALQYPSLNVRGLRAARVGDQVRTIIPSEAIAEIDMRLVPETPAERQIQLVKEFIRSHGFHLLDSLPTEEERMQYPKLIRVTSRIGSRPFRTNLDSPLGTWLGLSMDRVFGEGNYIKVQATGGSQPIAPFITTLDIPAISVRIPNPDNNIHAPNENIRLGNFYEGLQMCLAILTQPYE